MSLWVAEMPGPVPGSPFYSHQRALAAAVTGIFSVVFMSKPSVTRAHILPMIAPIAFASARLPTLAIAT